MPAYPLIAIPRRRFVAAAVLAALVGFGRWCLLCHARAAQRRHLAELEERMLDDVGITPAQARAESTKPWWRA